MKKSKVKILSAVVFFFLAFFLLVKPYQARAKCCPVVSVSNWGELASLMQSTLISVFQNSISPHLVSLLQEKLIELKTVPGVLKEESLEDIVRNADNIFYDSYQKMKNAYSSYDSRSSKAWYCTILFFLDLDSCKGYNIQPNSAVLKIFNWNDVESDRFEKMIAEYAYALRGDISYVDEYYNQLINFKHPSVSDDYKNSIGLAVGEYKAAKDQVVEYLFDNAAKLKVLNEYRKKLEEYDRRISGMNKYTTDQAMKDLLKIQMFQGLLLTELYETRVKEQMINAQIANLKMDEMRRNLVNEMHSVTSFKTQR